MCSPEPGSGEEELAVAPAVLLRGLHADAVEPLLDRARRLVGREDAAGGRYQGSGGVLQAFHDSPPRRLPGCHRQPT